ncbi:type II toxin-antitoxin system RelE/ParE family toxin [soil metagenome]
MKRYTVELTEHALLDLDDIADYIASRDGEERAEHVARGIEKIYASLALFPNRGAYARELLEIGNRNFREVHFKPYRIIYRVYDHKVVVFLIADGRRDMQTLLTRRLLGA